MIDFTVYVGFDSRNFGQEMAFEVCRRSILKHASQSIEVRQLILRQLQARGIYTRTEDPLASTEFTYTRFLVPYLNQYQGWALFCDSDFLWTDDVWKIFNQIKNDPDKAVYCVKHNIKKTESLKMNGLPQSNYPRKNWSSLMLFNCSHPAIKNLSLDSVNQQTPAWLHRLQWVSDNDIGELPHTYNYLVNYYTDLEKPMAIHYTDGGPWHPGYENCQFAHLWLDYLTNPEKEKNVEEREELKKEMIERLSHQKV